MPYTKDQVMAKAEAEDVSEAELGRRGGIKAHKILDWFYHDGTYYCETARNGWHRATARDYKLLKARGVLW